MAVPEFKVGGSGDSGSLFQLLPALMQASAQANATSQQSIQALTSQLQHQQEFAVQQANISADNALAAEKFAWDTQRENRQYLIDLRKLGIDESAADIAIAGNARAASKQRYDMDRDTRQDAYHMGQDAVANARLEREQKNSDLRTDMAQDAEGRAKLAESRAAADQLAQEADRAKKLLDEHNQNAFMGRIATDLRAAVRPKTYIPIADSPLYNGVLRLPGALDENGRPTKVAKDALREMLLGRGFKPEGIDGFVESALTPMQFTTVDGAFLQSAQGVGRGLGLTDKQIHDAVEASYPNLKVVDTSIGLDEGRDAARTWARSAFGAFDEPDKGKTTINLNAADSVAKARSENGPVAFTLNSMVIKGAGLQLGNFPPEILERARNANVSMEELADDSNRLFNTFGGGITVDPVKMQVVPDPNWTVSQFERFKRIAPVLNELGNFKRSPDQTSMFERLAGTTMRGSVESTATQADKALPKPKAQSKAPDAGGNLLQQLGALDSSQTSDEEELATQLLLGDDWMGSFNNALGIPNGYTPAVNAPQPAGTPKK